MKLLPRFLTSRNGRYPMSGRLKGPGGNRAGRTDARAMEMARRTRTLAPVNLKRNHVITLHINCVFNLTCRLGQSQPASSPPVSGDATGGSCSDEAIFSGLTVRSLLIGRPSEDE